MKIYMTPPKIKSQHYYYWLEIIGIALTLSYFMVKERPFQCSISFSLQIFHHPTELQVSQIEQLSWGCYMSLSIWSTCLLGNTLEKSPIIQAFDDTLKRLHISQIYLPWKWKRWPGITCWDATYHTAIVELISSKIVLLQPCKSVHKHVLHIL